MAPDPMNTERVKEAHHQKREHFKKMLMVMLCLCAVRKDYSAGMTEHSCSKRITKGDS